MMKWVRTFNLKCLNGQNGNAEATAVIDDSASNTVVIVGNVKPVTGGATCQRAFIAKFNASGTPIWVHFVSSANATDLDFQSIKETGVAQQYVITGSLGLPGLNRRVLLYVVNTSGAAPVTVLARGLFSTGPTPNYPVANQYGYDVVTRNEPTKKEYFICGANQYTTGQTDGIIFRTDINGTPLGQKIYNGVGKEQFNAIDFVSNAGAAGNGIAAFGNNVRILGPGIPTRSLAWLMKTYFNLVSGCNEVSDNPQSLTLSLQYTSQAITTVKTFTKDSLTSQNSTVLDNKICWATTIASGSNTRVEGSAETDEAGSSVDLSFYPNPVAADQATLVVNSMVEGNVSIKLFDATGKLSDEFTYYVTEGKNEIQMDVADLISGIFLLQVSDGKGETKTIRLMKL
ncbi:MAG: T9SS type A sorting domain-containing protein [Bacteroidetes bacterium]|nr:T9SS type A sorting domain-containing protein [Bacteroidota bacterium]